ncbi:T9SS type A sorting domain-containing protein [Lacinutrix salivirga]
MKTFYTTILFVFITVFSYAQSYSYGIINTDGYNFKIVAIPDFDASTDASDMGFTLSLPAGVANITNVSSLLPARTWSMLAFDAAFLTSQGLGDGTRDVFQFNNPPGQSLLAHSANDQIDLVSFTVSNMPTTGEMTFLDNTDPVAAGAGGVLDSFYNSNIDNTTTQDYFGGYAPGLTSIQFNTLGVDTEQVLAASISVYPNPTIDSISIKATVKIDSAMLFDITGKEILNVSQPTTLSLANLASGVYLLKLYTENTTVVKRIVKK